MATATTTRNTTVGRMINGALGGLAGGVVFGAMMGMMGMLPMVASLIKSESAFVGLGLHMVFSAIIGAGYGLVFGNQTTTLQQGLLWGAIYGVIWWVLGPMILMPLMMGMGLQFAGAFTAPMLKSLLGHVFYGVIAGAFYAWYSHRR